MAFAAIAGLSGTCVLGALSWRVSQLLRKSAAQARQRDIAPDATKEAREKLGHTFRALADAWTPRRHALLGIGIVLGVFCAIGGSLGTVRAAPSVPA